MTLRDCCIVITGQSESGYPNVQRRYKKKDRCPKIQKILSVITCCCTIQQTCQKGIIIFITSCTKHCVKKRFHQLMNSHISTIHRCLFCHSDLQDVDFTASVRLAYTSSCVHFILDKYSTVNYFEKYSQLFWVKRHRYRTPNAIRFCLYKE